MFWHIDSDIICFLMMSALFIFCLRSNPRGKRDIQSRRFLWCLRIGLIVTLIDIFASVAMEVPTPRFMYHLLITLDFLGLELAMVFWFYYCISILYHSDEKRLVRSTRIVTATFAVYALFILSNPWTRLIYTLGANNLYERGPLFALMTVVYIVYTICLMILLLIRRKCLPAGYPVYVLPLTPIILGGFLAAQLTNPGWLMLLPGYLFSLTIAFLFLQTRRDRQRVAAEQMSVIMDHVSGGICASSLSPHGKLHILLANNAYYSMFGYTKAEYEEEVADPLYPVLPDDRDKTMGYIKAAIASGNGADYEYRARRRDGRIVTIHCQNSMTQIPGLDDEVLLAVLTDITVLKAAEDAARVHEAEMQLAMAQMGKMLCEYDPETRTLTMPESYAQRFCLPTVLTDIPDNAARRKTIEPEFLAAYQSFYEAIRCGDATGSFDLRTRWADSSLHWEHVESYSIFDAAGKPVKAIIAVEDTTKQHELFELERSRPSLGEQNLLIHALFDLSTGETLDYAYCDGRPVPEKKTLNYFLSREHLDTFLISPDERARFRALNNKEKLIERFRNGETELTMDYRRKLSDDEIIWVRNILRMVRKPGSNDILLFEYCYNIEEEKTQTLMYNALVHKNFDFVGRFNGKNRHYSLLTSGGISALLPPLTGDNMDDMVRTLAVPNTHPEDQQAMLDNINVESILKKLNETDQYQFTSRLVDADGTVLYKLLTMYYLDRERQTIILTREDVSKAVEDEMRKNEDLTKALAAAEDANRAKTRFLSRMSHELRTPMNIILGVTELAAYDEHISPQMKESCETITTSGQYLLSLINDILEISRIEGGKLTLTEAPFSLSQLLEETAGLLNREMQQKAQRFTLNIKPGTAAAYIGDRMKLQQILSNLLGNAVKFTPENGRILLTAEQLDSADERAVLRFAVKDSGTGISEEFLPHLFKLFTQEVSGNTSATTGTGLGLPIVKNLVELMGGDIRVESVKGEGSVFTVEVSLRPAESEVAPAPRQKKLPDLSGLRLLSVEDNAMNELVLEHLLKMAGAEVIGARNGQLAVDAFRDAPTGYFDAILMDIRMPVMDGLTATRSIRALDKADAAAVPIIAISANAFDEDVELSLASGMNAHLAKPIDPPVLLSTLTHWISAARADKMEA